MQRITYREILDFNKAINWIINLRRIYYTGSPFPNIFYDGDNGLKMNLQQINNFYSRHLRGIKLFDMSIKHIDDLIQEINEDDLINGLIPKIEYKQQILDMINTIETLSVETDNLFTMLSLYKFYNSTFQPNTLMNNVNYLYKPEVWEFMPENTKNDVIEGAKALLVHIPTGASFLFLRGLEGCIRKLCEMINPEHNEIRYAQAINVLTEYFKELELDEKTNKFIERQLILLQYIKDEFRNPAAHPEKSFTQDEAERLFQVVNEGINKVYELSKKICDK